MQLGFERANGYGTSDYKGCTGESDRGIFFKVDDGLDNAKATVVRPADVTDGLSKTIAFGESSYYIIIANTRYHDWPIWMGGYGAGSDESTLFKTQDPSIINCGIVPKSLHGFRAHPAQILSAPWTMTAISVGTTAAHFFAFADGSVHFLPETIGIRTYRYLGTINDGNVIPVISGATACASLVSTSTVAHVRYHRHRSCTACSRSLPASQWSAAAIATWCRSIVQVKNEDQVVTGGSVVFMPVGEGKPAFGPIRPGRHVSAHHAFAQRRRHDRPIPSVGCG